MAVPDPYKAAKSKPTIPVPTGSGSVPTPTQTTPKPTIGVIGKSGTVPNPNAVKSTSVGLKPITSTTGGVPKPPETQKSAISTPEYTDWMAKQNETFANLEKLVNTPFSYDPNTDPAYQAQRQLAQLRAGDATRNALETANEKGILGSSMNVSQLGQIQQRAEQEAAAYIPEYRQQAYGQHQDRLSRVGELLGQARNLRGDQFNESVTEANLTGNYMSPEARSLVNNLLTLKADTEANWSRMSDSQRTAARQQGDALRAQLQGMGVDSSMFGADVAANDARGNLGAAGLRTMAGQELDTNQDIDQRNYDRSVFENDRAYNEDSRRYNQEFQYTQGRDAVSDARWEQEFQRILRQDGVDNALRWAANSISQQNANTSAGNLALSRDEFNYRKDQDSLAQNVPAADITAKQSADNYNLLLDDITSGIDKATARQLLQANQGYLSDSDYKKLNDYINNNL